MATNESTIREITDPAEFANSARVIRNSFKTVAEEFGLNKENAPTHPAFLTVRWLREKKSDDVKFFGLFLVPQGHHKFDKRLACQSSGGTASRQIGFVVIEKENAGTYWVEKLVVLPAHRHGGSGAKLIGFGIDYIREHGGKKVALGMMDEHAVLKNWYKKLGFREISTQKYPHLPFTVCYMERDASPLLENPKS